MLCLTHFVLDKSVMANYCYGGPFYKCLPETNIQIFASDGGANEAE